MTSIPLLRAAIASAAAITLLGCTGAPTESRTPYHAPGARFTIDPSGVDDGAGLAAFDAALTTSGSAFAAFNTLRVGGPANGSNSFPFGGTGATGIGANRYQQAYAASAFNSTVPLLIQRFSFFNGVGVFSPNTYTLYLSTTPVALNSLSLTNFNGNRGADNTLVESRYLSGPAPATLTFERSVPFLYNPANGNLLLDVVVSPGGGVALPNRAFYAARNNDAFGTLSRAHNFGTGFNGYGLVTDFELAPLSLDNLALVASQAATNGRLTGAGPGNSASQLLAAWMSLLASAQAASASGNDYGACALLAQAYVRADGRPQPPDFVGGPSVADIAALIGALRSTLNCPPPV